MFWKKSKTRVAVEKKKQNRYPKQVSKWSLEDQTHVRSKAGDWKMKGLKDQKIKEMNSYHNLRQRYFRNFQKIFFIKSI